MRQLLRRLWCWVRFHKLKIIKHIEGDINHGTRLIECRRCGRLFVMSDPHQAFFCYSDDPHFAKELMQVYGITSDALFGVEVCYGKNP